MRNLRLAALVLILAGLLDACGGAMQPDVYHASNQMNTDFQNKLTAEIARRASAQDDSVLKIQSLTNFEWDKFHVFTPMTPFSEIARRLGGEISADLRKTDIESRDNINLLVFSKQGKVVNFVEFPRGKGDFDKINRPTGFTAQTANFRVLKEDRGEPWVTVLEAN